MSFFMSKEIEACRVARDDLHLARKFSQRQVKKAKTDAALLITSPEGLLACFSAGAVKGLTKSKSSKKFENSLSQIIKLVLKLGL